MIPSVWGGPKENSLSPETYTQLVQKLVMIPPSQLLRGGYYRRELKKGTLRLHVLDSNGDHAAGEKRKEISTPAMESI